MRIEKGTMKTEVIFSDDKKNRYLLRREWDNKKPKATIIMTNPSTADLFSVDYTTLYILNNLLKLDFGGVDIVNLVSICTTKLSVKELTGKLEEENIQQIVKSAEAADKVIIAWGKGGENSQKLGQMQLALHEHLRPYEKKLCLIADGMGRAGFHPLAPQIRFVWHLRPFEIPKPIEVTPTQKKQESDSAGAVAPEAVGA
ncbi:MAG: DUF1643 domain-containing protein [Oscillospiraceae bacterium]|nr:DUF1643 domain-containing protein [Oscillospiraceae bacterium]